MREREEHSLSGSLSRSHTHSLLQDGVELKSHMPVVIARCSVLGTRIRQVGKREEDEEYESARERERARERF